MSHPEPRGRHRAAPVALGILLLLSGCGDGDGGTQPTPPSGNRPPSVGFISESTDFDVHLPGEVVPLSITASDPDGDALTINWSLTSTSTGSLSPATGTDVSWTAGAGVGVDSVEVRVSDGQAEVLRRVVLQTGTDVGGPIATNVVWRAASSPYVLTDNLDVQAGARLTIEPGVEIHVRKRFVNGAFRRITLTVRGELDAVGTLGAGQIVLRGASNSDTSNSQHDGIHFAGTGTGILSHVRIVRGTVCVANNSQGAVTLYRCTFRQSLVGYQGAQGSQANLRRVLVEGLSGDGILLTGADATLRVCRIRDNTGAGLAIRGTSGTSTVDVDSCEFDSNQSTNLFVTPTGNLTVHDSNILKNGTSGTNVTFSGGGGSTVDLTTCWWGLLNAGQELQEIQATFVGASSRSWIVLPPALAPIALPNVP